MKTPKARRLPSGSWFVRVRVDGQDISITRPTEKEALAEAMAVKAGIRHDARTQGRDKTVSRAIDDYIAARQNILSPSTIRGYRIIQHNRFQPVMQKRIGSISPQQWQSVVNAEARIYSAKTVKNSWGFISSVIHDATGKNISVRLPQVITNERCFLDPDQIPVFIKAVKGNKVEIASLLALSSLRRSEIVALMWDDVDLEKGVLRIVASTVPDENNKMVRKNETKNSASRRTVPIIEPLQRALEAVDDKSGPVVHTGITRLYENINKVCRENGLPEVGVHGLRHSFASLAYYLKMPEKVAMEIGGWSDETTMRRIYTHVAKETRKDYTSEFTNFFKNGNENGNENA